jgi:IclR family transcriptional regulator, acetate operon repressor
MDNTAGSGAPDERRDTTVQSVDRAVTILEILARKGDAGVTEIAAELDVHKSTASRLLSVLERRGLTMQVSERGRYRLGFRVLLLANASVSHLDLTQLSRPVGERLAAAAGETVNVAILEDDVAINVAQVRGSAAVSTHNWIGQRTPLHATSSGKVLLAHLSPAQRARLLQAPLERLTPATVVDRDGLEAQLADVRRQGWACTLEELEIGLNAVAAPIRAYEGNVIAAMSVSGPSYRLAPDNIPELAKLVVTAADEISEQLGFRAG